MFETQEAPTPKEDLLKHLRLMREAHKENPMPDLEKRKDRLRRLLEGFQEREEVFTQSISEDFGLRSTFETANYDIT
ncbi:MAG TPA: hypothetical protein QF623_00490, partial [SAR324 cluster bacterium]|nr:hypothetical protein [SAR324 cluster bacterium]